MNRERRLVYLNPRDLLPSRQNVRSDPGDLAKLAETIDEHGILQPLGVMPDGKAYRVVYGGRRRQAAIIIGLDRVPCMILDDVKEEDVVVQQMLENLQRLDLGDMEKAQAFARLLHHIMEEGLSRQDALEEVAHTLGLSARQIRRYLRLRQLCPEVRHLVAEGELSVTHGQHLVGIAPDERQAQVAHLTVEEGLSAAELSRLCRALRYNANIDPGIALQRLRRGKRIAVLEDGTRETPPPLPSRPMPEKEEGIWEEDEERDTGPEPESPSEYGHLESTTRDGNRLRQIRSIDSFTDEVQRLTQCVQEGWLQRLLSEEGAGMIKVRLAARQLRFLADAVLALVQTSERVMPSL